MLPVALSFEDLIKVQMTVSEKGVAYSHAVVVLSFAAAMELDTAFSERHGNELLAQPFEFERRRKKTFASGNGCYLYSQ